MVHRSEKEEEMKQNQEEISWRPLLTKEIIILLTGLISPEGGHSLRPLASFWRNLIDHSRERGFATRERGRLDIVDGTASSCVVTESIQVLLPNGNIIAIMSGEL